jgi:hypothetical protein
VLDVIDEKNSSSKVYIVMIKYVRT